jgi:predicted nucleotidyltransferase
MNIQKSYIFIVGKVLCMDERTKQRLFDKNNTIINMVIERAKRDFPEDIAIIGLTGSFSTGDFHEKSDLDLIIINNTDRGWEISSCFILEDVGYDIYCTPWETRIEAEASLKSPMISCLVDLQILYCAKPEYLDKFNAYKQRALDTLAKPIGKECIERAKECIDIAKQEYTNTLLSDNVGTVRYAAGRALYNLINAIVNLNNTYFKRGLKRYLEQLATFQYMPDEFEKKYMAVVSAKTIHEIRNASYEMLKSIIALHDEMYKNLVKQPLPTYDNLCGTYEELWCNCRNKVIVSTESKDKSYVYHVALGAQGFLDEMTKYRGTKKFDLMKYFDADDLPSFKEAFLRLMDEYLDEYNKVGRKVERYDSFDELYNHFMKV